MNLRGGRAGVHQVALDGELSGPELSPFRYVVFGLAGCSGAEYLARREPLAWALAALMSREGNSKAAHKLACQRRIGGARLSDESRILLIDFLEAYLELTQEEAREYKILGAQYPQEATAVWMIWSERMKAEGRKEGLKLGKQEGRQEGLQEGVRSLQQILIFQLEQRFGPLSEGVHRQVEAIESLRRLTRLAERVLTVGSLRELRLR